MTTALNSPTMFSVKKNANKLRTLKYKQRSNLQTELRLLFLATVGFWEIKISTTKHLVQELKMLLRIFLSKDKRKTFLLSNKLLNNLTSLSSDNPKKSLTMSFFKFSNSRVLKSSPNFKKSNNQSQYKSQFLRY